MAGKSGAAQVPVWAIPAAIVVLVLVVGLIAWKTLGKHDGVSDAPPVAVHPGMYDFKQAAADGSLGKGTGSGLKGNPP